MAWRKIKPGWYLLALLFLYSLIITTALVRGNRQLRALQRAEVIEPAESEPAEFEPPPPQSLWFPVPGASVPQDAAYLPGAPRVYRRGVNQGFDFYSEDAGVPISYGTPVVAAVDATVTRVDTDYEELGNAAWQDLLSEVSQNRADEAQLDRLRGRQLWLSTPSGRILRYGHLSSIRPGLAVGQEVYRGQVVGFVGNSGTDDGVAGTKRGARLHFEVWEPDGTFFGQDLDEAGLRQAASSLFEGP